MQNRNVTNSFREWLREAKLNEMSPSYTPEKTGLKEFIWVSAKMGSHGPRIKVYESLPNGINFSVTIEDKPRVVAGKCFVNTKELNRIFDFIILNKTNLLLYWNECMSSAQITANIEKLK